MAPTISITVANGKCCVVSPYNPSFVSQAQKLNGDFLKPNWVFDARDEERVRELCREVYGTDGSHMEVVTARVRVDSYGFSQSLYLFGRQLAKRWQRDDRVVLGDGVIVVTGGFSGSGGSVKNPRLDINEGTVLEVRDIPAGHADLTNADVEIITTETGPDELLAEKARLETRLAEINARLGL